VSECDREAWTLMRPCRAIKKNYVISQVLPVAARFVSGQNVFCWFEMLHELGFRSYVC